MARPATPANAAPEAAPADTGLQVYVRMYRALDPAQAYRGMLGDCFLIRLVDGQRRSHIMIDCGMLMGSADAVTRLKHIAKDIVCETGGDEARPGELDLLVVTHRHWDHISGFSQAADILLDQAHLRIANLWLAWPEKDGDPQAARLWAGLDKAGFALAALGERVGSDPGLQALDGSKTIRALNNFLGDADNVSKHLKGGDIMTALKKSAIRVDFLEPGAVLPTPRVSTDAPSIRAYVLGPPRDEKLLAKDDPSSGAAQETYLASSSLSDAILSFARPNDHDAGSEVPFAPQYCDIEIDQLANDIAHDVALLDDRAWIADHYYRLPGVAATRQDMLNRRQVDEDWLGAASALAMKLDSHINNTSLALAFDLPDGTSMLFAADAQVGNWLSWHNQTYRDESGTEHTAEQILNRTRFYKVGHHGSKNATLDKLGLAMMARGDLVAAIPTDEAFGKTQGSGWQMPNPRVEQALFDRTRGRIMRNDRRYTPADRARDPRLAEVPQEFFDKLTDDDLYLEYRVL